MTFVNWIQVALGAVVVWLSCRRAKTLLFDAAIDATPFVRAFIAALREGRQAEAERLAIEARPSWVAELTEASMHVDPSERDLELDVLVSERRQDALTGLRALRVLASISTSFGLIGAIVELRHGFDAFRPAFGAGRRLTLLQLGVGRAMSTMSLGVAVALFAITAFVSLKASARDLIGDMHRARSMLDEIVSSSTMTQGKPPA